MAATPSVRLRSALLLDVGSAFTRAILVEVVGEAYRFVAEGIAPTTAEPPHEHLLEGVRQAIRDLEATSGRRLLEGDQILAPQTPEGYGVDQIAAVVSAAPFTPVILMGISRRLSLQVAQRSFRAAPVLPITRISLEDAPPQPDGAWVDAFARALNPLLPAPVVLVGGVDGGPVEGLLPLLQALRIAGSLHMLRAALQRRTAPPPLFFAGNQGAQEAVQSALAGYFTLRFLPNVRPRPGVENPFPLTEALRELHRERDLAALPGWRELEALTDHPPHLPLEGMEVTAAFLARWGKQEVLAAEVGHSRTRLVWSSGREVQSLLHPVGTGFGLAPLLEPTRVEALSRLLPYPEPRLRERLLHHLSHPHLVPETEGDVAFLAAVSALALREAWAAFAPPPEADVVVAGGALRHLPAPGWIVWALLEGLAPTGEGASALVELHLDRQGLLPLGGLLAHLEPTAAAALLLEDGWTPLATLLVPLGEWETGQRILTLTLTRDDGSAETVEVHGGELVRIPLPPGRQAHLEVRPRSSVHLGRTPPGAILSTPEEEPIRGSLLGLVVDARGRPRSLPAGPEEVQRDLETLGIHLQRQEVTR